MNDKINQPSIASRLWASLKRSGKLFTPKPNLHPHAGNIDSPREMPGSWLNFEDHPSQMLDRIRPVSSKSKALSTELTSDASWNAIEQKQRGVLVAANNRVQGLEGRIEELQRTLGEMEQGKNHLNTIVESQNQTIKQLNACLKEVVQERSAIIRERADKLASTVDREASSFLARVQELESQRDKAQNSLQEALLRHQEQAFKHMKSGLWTPLDENKIVSDLKKMKKRIRT